MNQTPEPSSNRSGRFTLGALVVALSFGGISSKINNDLTTEKHSLEKDVNNNVVIIAEKTDTIAKKIDAINELTGERNQLLTETRGLHQQVVSLTTDLTERKLQIADLDKKLVATTTSLEQTKNQLEASTGREKDLNGKLELAGRREATLRADLTAGIEREGSLKNTIASLEKARTDLNSALESRSLEIAEARKREEFIKADLSTRMGDLKLSQERETMLKGEVLAGIQREQGAKSSLSAIEKEKSDLAAAMKTKAEEVAKLDKGLSDLNKAFADAQATKDALLKTNETLGKEKSELMTARDTLQKQINELSEKIKALTDQNKTNQGSLQSLQQEKSVVAEQFKTVQNEIHSIALQRDALKGERDQFQAACNELMSKLELLTTKVKALEKDFISMNNTRNEAAGFVASPR